MSTITDFGATYVERIENAVNALKAGKGVLLVDDENRENEGDIIFPAETMTPADMAYMIRECSGIVCVCISQERADHLQLKPMVIDNTSQNQTAFTISIEAKNGVTTGVSAADRITTIRAAVNKDAKAEDLAHPGHVFPLVARPNGVLEREGHTEGSIDIVRLAGMGDSAVLCEVQNEDGTMARLPEIMEMGKKTGMPVLTIEDIQLYRKEVIGDK